MKIIDIPDPRAGIHYYSYIPLIIVTDNQIIYFEKIHYNMKYINLSTLEPNKCMV
jgi:hypothetical protein